jgi:hypothetical protein
MEKIPRPADLRDWFTIHHRKWYVDHLWDTTVRDERIKEVSQLTCDMFLACTCQ